MSNNKITTYLQLHLFELKYNFFILLITFFYLFIVSYYFSNQLIYLFINILINKDLLKYFIFTNITEIFITNIFISFFVSFFLIFQLSMIQSWFFFSSGLFKYENFRIVKIYLIFLIFNFFIISIILIKIIPNIWYFFLNINFSNKYLFNIYFEPKLNNYFNFIFSSFIYIFFIFIYFFLLFLIIFNNIFKIKTIINLRKFFFLKFIIISAIISPPDFINQLLLFFLFIILFEIFIYIYIFLYKYFLNKI